MWLVGTTCFSPPSPVSHATKPGHAAFLPMTGWHLVVLHQTLTAGNERGRCAQCGAGGRGVHPRNAECFHPGCSWGDGGGTSAAHVWAVLSGWCCRLAVRSLSLGCGRFWVRFWGAWTVWGAGAVLVAACTAALTCSKSTPCLYPSEMDSGCSPREGRSVISSPSFSDLCPPCSANPILSPSCS